MRTQIVRITKDFRINIPKEFIDVMGLEPDSFCILELDEEKRSLTAYKAKVVKD